MDECADTRDVAPTPEGKRETVVSVDVGVRNLAIAVLNESKLLDVEVVDVASENGKRYAREASPADVVASLSKRPWLRSCDVVVVERQPARARSMRAIQAVIESHFLTLSAMDLEGCNIKRVVAFDAKAKLADVGKTLRGSKNYAKRKSASVEGCLRYLEATGQPKDLLQRFKKKDDAADAIMQGLAFIGWRIPEDVDRRLLGTPTSGESIDPDEK